MAQDERRPEDDFSQLWQRHLLFLRDDFSTTSVQALPSLPSGRRSLAGDIGRDGGKEERSPYSWDDRANLGGDVSEELTLQSPHTTETRSPGTPWFPDRETYTETALSSPANSSWPRPDVAHKVYIDEHGEGIFPEGKGKGVISTLTPIWHHGPSPEIPFLLQKQLLDQHNTRIASSFPVDDSVTSTAATVTLPTRSARATQNGPPAQVDVLLLSWATRTQTQTQVDGVDNVDDDDGDNDTEILLRTSLKRRGYRVQCRPIPLDYPTAAMETLLDRFLEKSGSDSLLLVYYHGWGCLDGEGRMVFSSGPGDDASRFFWDDVRDPVMQAPGDVLLVFDCTALPGTGAEQREMRVEAGLISSPSTKQLLGVCAPPNPPPHGVDESPGAALRCEMTVSLCGALERTDQIPAVSVQRLCSLMRQDLRDTDLASSVFVSQLGGGQLFDIFLPKSTCAGRETGPA